MKIGIYRGIGIVLVLAFFLAATGCQREKKDAPDKKPAPIYD